MQLRHFKTQSFPHRLEKEARALTDRVRDLRSSEKILRKARQLEIRVHINEWLSSPGLQAPK